jgi:hypothetical protein
MKRHPLFYIVLIGAVAIPGAAFVAQAATEVPPPPTQRQLREPPVYGWQLMTPAEREAFHRQMMAAQTPEEHEQLRQTHHALMAERAKERGVALPPEPMMRRGMGPGMGMR